MILIQISFLSLSYTWQLESAVNEGIIQNTYHQVWAPGVWFCILLADYSYSETLALVVQIFHFTSG